MHRLLGGTVQGEGPAVRPHDTHALCSGLPGQAPQVRRDTWCDIGVHDRCRGSFVLSVFREESDGHRQRYVQPGKGIGYALLVTGIRIRVQEHDRNRFRAAHQLRECFEFSGVERLDGLTVGPHPALDAVAVITVY